MRSNYRKDFVGFKGGVKLLAFTQLLATMFTSQELDEIIENLQNGDLYATIHVGISFKQKELKDLLERVESTPAQSLWAKPEQPSEGEKG